MRASHWLWGGVGTCSLRRDSRTIDRAELGRSIEEVCRVTQAGGRFVAYRNDGDRQQARIWKEVTCKGGQIDEFWKECFPSEDTLTVLSYDAAGKAVKQAYYCQRRLMKESIPPLAGC